MNKNILVVLAGGFLIAVLVAVMVQISLKKSPENPQQQVQQNVDILVAAQDMKVGHEIKEGDLKWQKWPENSVFAGSVVKKEDTKLSDFTGGRLTVELAKGQPFHRSFVVKKEDNNNFLAATLREGMRAVGVSVKAHTMAGGFIGPGDYVDVMLTYKVPVKSRDNPAMQSVVSRYATETIIENVRVLATDQNSVREEDKAKVARTVTLEVKAEDAEKLSLASEMGDITLTLRGIGDDTKMGEKHITTDVGISKVLKNIAKLQESSAGGVSGTVRVYNGDVVQNVPVRQTTGYGRE